MKEGGEQSDEGCSGQEAEVVVVVVVVHARMNGHAMVCHVTWGGCAAAMGLPVCAPVGNA